MKHAQLYLHSQMPAACFRSCYMQEFGWAKGKNYLRLDGKLNPKIRQRNNQVFQDPHSSAQVGCRVAQSNLLHDLHIQTCSFAFVAQPWLHTVLTHSVKPSLGT